MAITAAVVGGGVTVVGGAAEVVAMIADVKCMVIVLAVRPAGERRMAAADMRVEAMVGAAEDKHHITQKHLSILSYELSKPIHTLFPYLEYCPAGRCLRIFAGDGAIQYVGSGC